MDPFHARLARVALAAAEPYGFALAGGYAVQVHGFLDRPSADVDIFTTSRAEGDFPAAVDAVLAALRGDGLVPEAEIRNASFARIAVAALDGGTTKIEMGVDWRASPSRTIPDSTDSGSPRHWPPSTGCQTTGSGSTTSLPPKPPGSRRGLVTGRQGSGTLVDG
jgi:hypothetical protein